MKPKQPQPAMPTASVASAQIAASPTHIRSKSTVPSATSLTQITTGNISRSISACNRCRSRKTKCDQLFPACTACAKANVDCVGVDAATGREIPRSYVSHLEERVAFLEKQLAGSVGNGTSGGQLQSPSSSGEACRKRKADGDIVSPLNSRPSQGFTNYQSNGQHISVIGGGSRQNSESQTPTSTIGQVEAAREGLLGPGGKDISFAELMFAAVKVSSKTGGHLPPRVASFRGKLPEHDEWKKSRAPGLVGASNEDGSTLPPTTADLQTVLPKPTPATFPSRSTAEKLGLAYFNQANPQIPILHRTIFMEKLNIVYDWLDQRPGLKETDLPEEYIPMLYYMNMVWAIATGMNVGYKDMPEQFHAAAMKYIDTIFTARDKLDTLKGVLLLALYSLMRPAVPGVWYVVGSALRICIDLGLHQEPTHASQVMSELTIDTRRRLFWCAYSLDRQVCVYLGRPFGISDDAIKVPFPLEIDDSLISERGIEAHPNALNKNSRTIACHMFRIRQLQSEIQKILYQQSELPRAFKSITEWRKDMEKRLNEWTVTVPKKENEANCGYNMSFIDLNYQQTRLLLYGLSPAVPKPDTAAFLVISDAGDRIIKAYRSLHRAKSINYTWLACHNLFTAGTSYLCALWHSSEVRKRTTVDQIDHNAMLCRVIFESMQDRCPAAIGCRDVFENLASATIQFCGNKGDLLGGGHPTKRIRGESSSSRRVTEKTALEPVHHALPASLANIVHHVPSPPPSEQNMLTPISQPRHTPSVQESTPKSTYDVFQQDTLVAGSPLQQQQQQSMAPPVTHYSRSLQQSPPALQDPFVLSPPSQSPISIQQQPVISPGAHSHHSSMSMQSPHSAQDLFSPHPGYLPENNPNLEQIMRTAGELSNDASYNIFNSGYGDDSTGAGGGEDGMGGKIYQLMSDVGGGSIWGDQFMFELGDGSAGAAAGVGYAVGYNGTLSMMGGGGVGGATDHFSNFVGFSGGL
ncbi:Fungal specific transcription factor [Orbilia blumenaviensis]|uniref:Fungal specific transcription factor n=1 Tax=Orbilia blumenaviensis TaxID=1796055 RepID=A0AAV9VI59_9PEZI